jgi:hypothetical protein
MRRTHLVVGILLLGGQGGASHADNTGGIKESLYSRVPLDRYKLHVLTAALWAYIAEGGKFPDSLDVLAQHDHTPDGRYRQPLLGKEYLIDGWGEPFGYEHSGDKYAVWSTGPDRKLGTEDDAVVMGYPEVYEESERVKQARALLAGGAETNTVQGATPDPARPPPATIEKTQPAVPPKKATAPVATQDGQPPDEPAGIPSASWKIPLLFAVLLSCGATAWRLSRRKRKA